MALRTWAAQLLSSLLLLLHVGLITARGVAVITQTNISSQYLTDPSLDLPFTSIFYLGAGSNATEFPPITVRIAQMQDDNSTSNSTDGWGPPTVIVTEHQPNFTIPDLINAPSGIAWHVSHIGALNDTLVRNVTSKDFMRTFGAGLLFDFWTIIADDVAGSYILGKADENVLCKVIIDKLGLSNTASAKEYASLVDQWESKITIKYKLPDSMTGKVQGRIMRMITADTGEVLDFRFKDSITIGPSPSTEPASEWIRTGTIEAVGNVHSTGRIYQGIYKKVFTTAMRAANAYISGSLQPADSIGSWQNCKPLNSPPSGGSSSPESSSDGSRSDSATSGDDESGTRSSSSTVSDESIRTPVSMVRQQGVMQTISIISKEAALAASIAVVAAAVTFVIIDFVDGNYIGGGLGVIGILANSLIPLFIDNPIGIVIGTAVAILFFLLPGVLGGGKPAPPPLHNTTEIIQYAFFRDAKHTGNEKCRETNPNCIASYGPGILAITLEWEYFDAVAFLLEFNQGFPMTIPDIAAAFGNATSMDKDINATAIAQITCGNPAHPYVGPPNRGPQLNTPPNAQMTICTTPKFHLNRDLITLPRINKTASEVYSEIIGPTGGTCKIIDNADNAITVPNYGITVQGLPVAIACGINAIIPGENVVTDATATATGAVSATSAPSVPNNDTTSHLTLPPGSSPGSLSTDGRDGEGYIPPPPPTPFANSLDPSNSACFTASNLPNYACLPNGTYDAQAGTFNLYNTKINGLYMAPGTVLNFQFSTHSKNWVNHHDASISSNQSSASEGDGQHFDKFAHMSSDTFDILVPKEIPLPPLACLFTKAQYGGDVTCVGLGGGNMTEGAGQVASVAIYGGASVTLFPNAYGDPGGQSFTVSVPDLTSVPYGTNSSLMDNVAAVLVLEHQIAIA